MRSVEIINTSSIESLELIVITVGSAEPVELEPGRSVNVSFEETETLILSDRFLEPRKVREEVDHPLEGDEDKPPLDLSALEDLPQATQDDVLAALEQVQADLAAKNAELAELDPTAASSPGLPFEPDEPAAPAAPADKPDAPGTQGDTDFKAGQELLDASQDARDEAAHDAPDQPDAPDVPAGGYTKELPDPPAPTEEELEAMSFAELKEVAIDLGFTGRGKAELVREILAHYEGAANDAAL